MKIHRLTSESHSIDFRKSQGPIPVLTHSSGNQPGRWRRPGKVYLGCSKDSRRTPRDAWVKVFRGRLLFQSEDTSN